MLAPPATMETRQALVTLFAMQGLVTTGSALIWWLAADGIHALAAFGGGIAVLVPGLAFAAKVFSVSPDASPKQVLGAFYRGEAIKIGLTVLVLVILLQWFRDTPLPLLATYILAILVYWPALLLGASRRPR